MGVSIRKGFSRSVSWATALGLVGLALLLVGMLFDSRLQAQTLAVLTATPVPDTAPIQATVSPAMMYVSPATVTVNAGQAFSVTVVVSSTEMMRGAQAGLNFDPALLEVTYCEEGSLFRDWAQADGGFTVLVPPEPAIDYDLGSVEVVQVAIFGGERVDDGPTGAGSFLVCHLTAKRGVSGQSALTLSHAAVADSYGNLLALAVSGGQVNVRRRFLDAEPWVIGLGVGGIVFLLVGALIVYRLHRSRKGQ